MRTSTLILILRIEWRVWRWKRSHRFITFPGLHHIGAHRKRQVEWNREGLGFPPAFFAEDMPLRKKVVRLFHPAPSQTASGEGED